MFMVNELDKLLAGFLNNDAKKKQSDEIKITLPDIKTIDVATFNIEKKLNWLADDDPKQSGQKQRDLGDISDIQSFLKPDSLLKQTRRLYLTSDLLFVSSISDLLLQKLSINNANNANDINTNQSLFGPRILICDSLSYSLLLKLRRLFSNSKLQPEQFRLFNIDSNFLYKKPFNFAAILTLPDVVDLFEKQQKPLLYRRQMRGKGDGYDFNYSLVKAAFPYLKMSHLTLLISEKTPIDFSHVNINGNREYLTLQMLNYFARSNRVITLKDLCRSLGLPHQIHDNFLAIILNDEINMTSQKPLNKLNLAHLVAMAEQLISLCDRLKLHLISITYRQNEIYGQTRAFSQFIGNRANNLPKNHIQSARVLILDRFHGLRSALAHADRYGAFLEQEPLYKSLGGDIEKLRVNSQDKLDEILQLIPLTELLSSIIEYTIDLKSTQTSKTNLNQSQKPKAKLAFGSSSAILRHLEIVKIICNVLNEGYLLLLKLESTLLDISNELASYSRNAFDKSRDQALRQLGEKISRIGDSYKQLIATSGKSIKVSDLLRTGFILMDVINSYLFLANNNSSNNQQQSGKNNDHNNTNIWLEAIIELKRSLTSGKRLKEAFKIKIDADQETALKSSDLGSIFADFDSITSKLITLQQLTLDYEQTVANFQTGKLDSNKDQPDYTTINLSDRKQSTSDVLIIVFLGPITANELSQLKQLECKLKKQKQTGASSFSTGIVGDLLVLTSGLVKPEDLVATLITKE